MGEAIAGNELASGNDINMAIDLHDLKLPPPKELSDAQCDALIRSSLVRIWDGAKDLSPQEMSHDADGIGTSSADLWMLLVIRLVTRFAVPVSPEEEEEENAMENGDQLTLELYGHQDRLRQALCDYIMADFSGR